MQLVYHKRYQFAWTGAAWNRWVRMTFQPRFSPKPRPYGCLFPIWGMGNDDAKPKNAWREYGYSEIAKLKSFVNGGLEGVDPEKSHLATIKWRCKLKRNIILYWREFSCNETTHLYRSEAVLYFILLKNKYLNNGKKTPQRKTIKNYVKRFFWLFETPASGRL